MQFKLLHSFYLKGKQAFLVLFLVDVKRLFLTVGLNMKKKRGKKTF